MPKNQRPNPTEDCDDPGGPESVYTADYLRDCADDDARRERLEELKRRIALDAYVIDPDRVAEELLLRGDLD